MPVMAAGMHHALCCGGIGQPGRFMDGQCIHISAQANHLAAGIACPLDHPDVAGAPDPLAHPVATAFLLLPIWLFLRMALNAIDGMLAREHGQKTTLGAYLNELTDVISDAALYLPFAFVAPFDPLWVGLVIWLAAISEMAGALGPMVGASRHYQGPMGKSDRAFVFGALGLWLGLNGALPGWIHWLTPVLALLIVVNIINRVRAGLEEVRA